MLTPQEYKVVLATLTQKRAWHLRALEDSSAEAEQRKAHHNTVKLLDSAMQKLARLKPSPAPAAPTTPTRKPKRQAIEPGDAYVLIAEDDHVNAQLLRETLEDLGITRIDVVENGRSALYALQNCSPAYDIVLCDWEMPEMNGLEVRRAVKSLAKLQDTHFVMVTGLTEVSRIREAINLGVNDYIAKPVNMEIFEQKIKAVLAGEEKSLGSNPEA